MPKKKKSAESLRDLLVVKLCALYDVEQQLVKALPKMADASTDEELRDGFTEHLAETEGHITRLEQAFSLLEMEPEALKVEGIRGIVEDAEWLVKNVELPAVLDAALIGAAAHAEHYEISGYTTAIEWANALGETEIAALLQETLEEEIAADEKMFDLGGARINEQAVGEESATADDEEEE